MIQWQSGEAASLQIMVVHAIVSLLTYGAPQLEQQSTCFGRLLEIWFPASGVQPQAYLVETTEEAHLYPDWIKLRMIRSSVDPIVDTALALKGFVAGSDDPLYSILRLSCIVYV